MNDSAHPDQAALERIVERALVFARAQGASAAEAAVGLSTGLSVTVRLGQVESLEYQRDRSLGVTLYAGQRKGSASTSNLSTAAVEETVAKALSIASFTTDDQYAGLPDAERMARRLPDLDLSHPWDLEAPAAIELARRCEAAGLASDPRIRNSEGASIATHRKLRVFGNSHGFVGGYPSTSHSISCVVLGQQQGDMQREYWYTAARDWRSLEDAEEVGRKAARKAVERLGAGRLTTRKAPLLFAPDLARGLIGHFVGAISGAAQYRRSSFLLDASGQAVFPEAISLIERPHLRGALGSAPFDGEGVATRDRELVVNGVLDGYLLDSYSARKLGLVTTGNAGGVHNLVVQGHMLDPRTLLRKLGTGLLVTEMMGQGINPVTGDYSRGAAGFWVENGELARPVHEITVAGNLRDMYRGIVAQGDDVDCRGAIHCGSLLIEQMTIAGD
jgi:PmbA protein